MRERFSRHISRTAQRGRWEHLLRRQLRKGERKRNNNPAKKLQLIIIISLFVSSTSKKMLAKTLFAKLKRFRRLRSTLMSCGVRRGAPMHDPPTILLRTTFNVVFSHYNCNANKQVSWYSIENIDLRKIWPSSRLSREICKKSFLRPLYEFLRTFLPIKIKSLLI